MLNYEQFLFEERVAIRWPDKDKEEFAKLQQENLFNAFEALSKYKIKHWIDCGTLLGIYRDGCLLPGDSDTDMGMMVEDIKPDFVEDFYEELGGIPRSPMFFRPQDFLEMHEDLEGSKPMPPKNMQFRMLVKGRQKTFKGKRIYTDLFMYYPLNKDRVYKFGRGYFRTKDSILQGGTKKMTVEGKQYPILNKTEDHLEVNYGKDWKEPNPGFKINKAKDIYGGPLSKKDIGGEYLYHFHTGKHSFA